MPRADELEASVDVGSNFEDDVNSSYFYIGWILTFYGFMLLMIGAFYLVDKYMYPLPGLYDDDDNKKDCKKSVLDIINYILCGIILVLCGSFFIKNT
jgi:hypothetical protein